MTEVLKISINIILQVIFEKKFIYLRRVGEQSPYYI